MISVTSATSSDAIRAVLGVDPSSGELPDTYFTDRGMAAELRLELDSWLPATLLALQAAAIAAGSESREERTWHAVKQAAAYWCASRVAATGHLAFFQALEDGQNTVSRPALKIADLAASLLSSYQSYRGMALSYYSGTTAATYSPSWMFGTSKPTFDPITG